MQPSIGVGKMKVDFESRIFYVQKITGLVSKRT